MFTQPAPSSTGTFPPLTTSTSTPTTTSITATTTAGTTTPATSGRGSRLRGLIHLRNYAHGHLLSSRDSNSHHQQNTTASPHTPTSSSSSSSSASATSHALARAVSHTPTSTRHDLTPAVAVDEARSPARDSQHLAGSPDLARDQQSRRRTAQYSEEAAEALSRSRTHQLESSSGAQSAEQAPEPTMVRSRSATTGDMALDVLPSIRFSAFYDSRSNRPSLSFTPVSRTLPTGKETIKVGRYSERENHVPVPTNAPSAAPVGFKSKVVSRRHCEFWYEKGKWYIRDVKSSSGTFLNHIRLSAPGTESKPFPINDGDIVQLGIDFKGGEEMIYRCVKMRIELNRGWQAKPNSFNVATHKRLRNMTSTASAASHAQDCSICLSPIAPCQSLFVAPCSHTWHYKCIREMLNGPSYPIFMCPNCRAAADLDAEVDEPSDEWQQLDSGVEDIQEEKPAVAPLQARGGNDEVMAGQVSGEDAPRQRSPEEVDAGDMTVMLDPTALEQQNTSTNASSSPVAIPNSTGRGTSGGTLSAGVRRTPSPDGNPTTTVVTEGPLTPRNDAGPWVFDGNPERVSQETARRPGMTSLDAAAQGGGAAGP